MVGGADNAMAASSTKLPTATINPIVTIMASSLSGVRHSSRARQGNASVPPEATKRMTIAAIQNLNHMAIS